MLNKVVVYTLVDKFEDEWIFRNKMAYLNNRLHHFPYF